jgi:hypothetical protein
MGESVSIGTLDFPEAIEIKLSYKAFKFVMPKIVRNYFFFHFFFRTDVDHCFSIVPTDDLRVFLSLNLMNLYAQ